MTDPIARMIACAAMTAALLPESTPSDLTWLPDRIVAAVAFGYMVYLGWKAHRWVMVGGIVVGVVLLGIANVASAAQPNIIVILVDDLGHGDLGSYGGPAATPHLDQLAAEGTRFTAAYATQVCSPTRAMLHTGQWPHRWGITSFLAGNHDGNAARGMADYLDPAAPSLPRALQDAGYHTALIGKWHLGITPTSPPVTDYGFDQALLTYWGHGDTQLTSNGDEYWRARSTARMASAALRVLCEHPTQPVYLQIGLVVPHSILNPTPYMLDAYSGDRPAADGYQGANVVYWSTLTYSIDLPIGRLLRDLPDPDNTIVIFTSDNGPESPHRQHSSHAAAGRCDGRGFKRSLYECGVKVPMIVRWPGRVPVGASDAVVSLVDLYPTLAALAGAAPPSAADGEDVSDIWLGADRPRRTALQWRQPDRQDMSNRLHESPQLAVRDGPWKLLTDEDGADPELYHIPSDPLEVDNLAAERPETVNRLFGYLAVPFDL